VYNLLDGLTCRGVSWYRDVESVLCIFLRVELERRVIL